MKTFGRDAVAISNLSPEQYRVTQQGATEDVEPPEQQQVDTTTATPMPPVPELTTVERVRGSLARSLKNLPEAAKEKLAEAGATVEVK